MFRIQIPKPCHEDWNAMTPTQQGAFCAACSKEVVDFTKMTDEEVQHYFLKNTTGKTCGRFRTEQVDRIRIYLPANILLQKIVGWKKFMAVLLLVFGSMLFGCDVGINQQTMGKPKSTDNSNIKQIDTSFQLLGDTSFIDTNLLIPVPVPNCTLVGFTTSYLADTATEKAPPEKQPTVEGEIELMPIGNIDKPDTTHYNSIFTGEIQLEKKEDSIVKKPVPDTAKCNDTGYY